VKAMKAMTAMKTMKAQKAVKDFDMFACVRKNKVCREMA
jgi:hypothetical protein